MIILRCHYKKMGTLLARSFVVQRLLPETFTPASHPPLADDPHQGNDNRNPTQYTETSVTTLVTPVVHANIMSDSDLSK
jgi:hypothetical protein